MRIRILIILLGFSLHLKAGNLYYVGLFSTSDYDIGESAQVVLDGSKIKFQRIANQIGYGFSPYIVSENDFVGRDNIVNTINRITTTEDDIIVFYGFSHGFRYTNQQSNFPYLKLSLKASYDTDPNLRIGAEEIYQMLNQKKARMRLLLFDACNNPLPDNITETEITLRGNFMSKANEPNAERYKELFLKVQGNIILTSAKNGQKSQTLKNYGSVLYNNFVDTFDEVVRSTNAARWSVFFTKLKANMQKDVNLRGNVQEPDYDLREFKETENTPISQPITQQFVFDDSIQKYIENIEKADSYFSKKQYNLAKNHYQIALTYKQNDIQAKQGVYLCRAAMEEIDFKEFDPSVLCNTLAIMSTNPNFQNQDFAFAQYIYGIQLIKGKGTCPKDLKRAEYWLRISYKNGMESACHIMEKVNLRRPYCSEWH